MKGLTQTWGEMIPYLKPPFPIKATLIPFGDCIISDGLVSPQRVSFGPEYRESFKQISAYRFIEVFSGEQNFELLIASFAV